MSKLKEDELKGLQEAIAKVNNIQMQIGGLEAQKHELLHSINKASEELSVVQKELEEKYGQVSINVQTGEITSDEPSKED